MPSFSSSTAPGRRTPRVTGLLIAVIVVALLGYLYATPYLALKHLKQAADARDAAALNTYVDYPALRVSLKDQLSAMLAKRVNAGHSGNPLALLGVAIGSALIGPLVDLYLTPDGVASLLDGIPPRGTPGERPPAPEAAPSSAPPSASTTAPAPAASSPGARTSAGYRGINDFVVTYQPGDGSGRYAAILHRYGLFSWKLAAVDLNADDH